MTYQPHQSEDATMGLNCTNPGGCRFPKGGMCLASCSLTIEPDPKWNRGPVTQPVELYDEAAFAEFDLARNVDKSKKANERSYRSALELQLQQFRADGWM